MGESLKIATEKGCKFEIFSEKSIPEAIRKWLEKKGIPYE